MTAKLGVLLLALLVGWLLIRSGRRRSRPAVPDATAFVRCPRCGVHHLAGTPCGCPGGVPGISGRPDDGES